MVIKFFLFFLFINILATYGCTQETLNFFDKIRNRSIPIEVYHPKIERSFPIVIISHGYSLKNLNKNKEYSFLAKELAKAGYSVFSVQHDLENDPPLSKMGSLFERRKPLWERGVKNILAVIGYIKKEYPQLKSGKVILIGHSNGGDISMLFSEKYSDLVASVISLDSLRYPFLSATHIPLLSFRAEDTKADEGVLPGKEATLIFLENVKHIDLCDRGPKTVKEKVAQLSMDFLRKHEKEFL